MPSSTHRAELLHGSAVLRAFGLPQRRKTTSHAKRMAAGALGGLVRPLRAIKPLDWLVSRAFQVWYQIPVAPTHFYSPLPDVTYLRENVHRWYREKGLAGIEMDFHRQSSLLQSLAIFSAECEQLPRLDQVSGYGLGYGEVEAHILHCMIRHLKPRNIIEVGSGVSTFFALNALEINRLVDDRDATMLCVEPYPKANLRRLVAQNKIQTFEKPVQEVEAWVFDQLGAGDILFIDSSHVSKVNSDVNFLILEILPRLRKGVIVQIHDIPFPYMTCPPGHPMFEKSLLWNEAALLRAFLMWNGVFEILMCQSYLHLTYPELIKTVTSIYDRDKHFPSSLWLQKVA